MTFKMHSKGLIYSKAPASTVGVLAEAPSEMFKSSSDIKIIGTRHGEKAHETLLTKERKKLNLRTRATASRYWACED